MDLACTIAESLKNYKTILILIGIVSLFYFYRISRLKGYKLPPMVSDRWWPILGHMHLISKNPHLQIEKWQKKHGPIYGLYYGKYYAVILGDFGDIKEVFKMEGMTDRLPEMFRLSPEFPNMLELNGKEWEDHRRFAMKALRGGLNDTPNENIVQESIDCFEVSMKDVNLKEEVNIRNLISFVTNNVGLKLISGKTYAKNHPTTKLVTEFNYGFQDYMSMNYLATCTGIPKWIFRLISAQYRNGLEHLNKMDTFIQSEMAYHRKTIDPDNPRDFLDLSLLDLEKTENDRKIQSDNHIRGDTNLLITAGTDTVRTTIEWICLYAAKYPVFQEKMYQEIKNVLGDRRATWADHQNMPYTEGFIMEGQRMRLMVPVNLPRCAPRDIVINGYDIPKGSLVIANFTSVHNDSKLWKDPAVFNPKRFINADGRAIFPEFLVPFSTGSRNCLGDKLAKMELFLLITYLIQNYKFLPSKNGVNLEGMNRVNFIPVYPFLRLELRTETHRPSI